MGDGDECKESADAGGWWVVGVVKDRYKYKTIRYYS